MKATPFEEKYVAWLSAESMHNMSRNWLSELLFAKDEQLFFDDLIKSYTLQLIHSKHFKKSKKMVEKLVSLQKETDKLISLVKKHERQLEIMVDRIDQLEDEENYKNEHKEIMFLIIEFIDDFKSLKKQLYKLIKGIIKESKQKRLLENF